MKQTESFDTPLFKILERIELKKKQAEQRGENYEVDDEDWRYFTKILESNSKLFDLRTKNFRFTLDDLLKRLEIRTKIINDTTDERCSFFP